MQINLLMLLLSLMIRIPSVHTKVPQIQSTMSSFQEQVYGKSIAEECPGYWDELIRPIYKKQKSNKIKKQAGAELCQTQVKLG